MCFHDAFDPGNNPGTVWIHHGCYVTLLKKLVAINIRTDIFRLLAIWCGFVRESQESDIFSWSSVRSATLRFYCVTDRFEYSATNINRRDAEFAETWVTYQFSLLRALEKIAYFF